MYSQLSVGILIDVEAVLQSRTFAGHTHMIDNVVDAASGERAPNTTLIVGNQVLNWLLMPIDWSNPAFTADITDITGEAVDKQILVPQLFDSPAIVGRGYWWGGTVDARLPGHYGYNLKVSLGSQFCLDLPMQLDVRTGFAMSEPSDQQSVCDK